MNLLNIYLPCCKFTLMEARFDNCKHSSLRIVFVCRHVSSTPAVHQTKRRAELTSDWQVRHKIMNLKKCLILFRALSLTWLLHTTL